MTEQPDRDDLWGEPIHVYTREQAIEDGTLIPTGTLRLVDGTPVGICFTANLHLEYSDYHYRYGLMRRGLRLLNDPHPEDDECRRLRVVIHDRVWAIWDGDGITFLKPEDY
ncbi:MAG: hypothetical protein O3A46_15580 [Candidatus Poribacteria bacterium]|nr:hypothetical protein [Candidatus Poribacteria bacterium]